MADEIPTLGSIERGRFLSRDKLDDEALRFINKMTIMREISETSALNYLLYRFFAGYTHVDIRNKELSQCEYCGTYIRFRKGKKFCSTRAEGVDCGKKVRNRRHYTKYREKLLPHYRKEMRDTREFMKRIQRKKK